MRSSRSTSSSAPRPGPRPADPQADRGRLAQGEGQEAVDDVLPGQGQELIKGGVMGARDLIPHRLLVQATTRPTAVAYQAKVNGRWQPTTWGAFVDQVRTAARALMAWGLRGAARSRSWASTGPSGDPRPRRDARGRCARGIYTTSRPRRSSTSSTTAKRSLSSSKTPRSSRRSRRSATRCAVQAHRDDARRDGDRRRRPDLG